MSGLAGALWLVAAMSSTVTRAAPSRSSAELFGKWHAGSGNYRYEYEFRADGTFTILEAYRYDRCTIVEREGLARVSGDTLRLDIARHVVRKFRSSECGQGPVDVQRKPRSSETYRWTIARDPDVGDEMLRLEKDARDVTKLYRAR